MLDVVSGVMRGSFGTTSRQNAWPRAATRAVLNTSRKESPDLSAARQLDAYDLVGTPGLWLQLSLGVANTQHHDMEVGGDMGPSSSAWGMWDCLRRWLPAPMAVPHTPCR